MLKKLLLCLLLVSSLVFAKNEHVKFGNATAMAGPFGQFVTDTVTLMWSRAPSGQQVWVYNWSTPIYNLKVIELGADSCGATVWTTSIGSIIHGTTPVDLIRKTSFGDSAGAETISYYMPISSLTIQVNPDTSVGTLDSTLYLKFEGFRYWLPLD